MISISQAKLIRSLHLKKNRDKKKLFLAEGDKIVRELIASPYKIHSLFATSGWIKRNRELLNGLPAEEISEDELKKISMLISPNEVIALAHIPPVSGTVHPVKGYSLALDRVRDP